MLGELQLPSNLRLGHHAPDAEEGQEAATYAQEIQEICPNAKMKQVATPTLRRQRRLAQRRFARVSKWPRPSPFRRPPREYLWGPWLRSKLRGGPPWCWNGKNHGFGSFGDQHAGSLHKPSLSRQSMRISPTLGETTLNKPSPAEALYENSPNAPTNPPFCNVLIYLPCCQVLVRRRQRTLKAFAPFVTLWQPDSPVQYLVAKQAQKRFRNFCMGNRRW